MLGLIDELGASDRVVFPRPVTVVYYQGKFYPFDSPQRWLSFPGFSWLDVVALRRHRRVLQGAAQRRAPGALYRRRVAAALDGEEARTT